MSIPALDIMWALVLENGKRWGEIAADFQTADAEAILADDGPRWHFVTRPRGASKTSDLAGMCLSWLVGEAPPTARGYVVASSAEQASLLIDAAAGFVTRTPELHGAITVEAERILAANGAWIRVLTADGSSAWGLREAYWIVCDEFAQWPQTRKAKRVWTAMLTSTQKLPGCRLVILTSAGEPGHFSYQVLKEAKTGTHASHWRVSETPGPVPWVNPADLAAQKVLLTDSEYARLHLNQWTESEDRLVDPADLDAACVLSGPKQPVPGVRYLLTADLGVKLDPTVVAISHLDEGRVVVDRLDRWVPARRKPVLLDRVEAHIGQVAKDYGADCHIDPSQALGMIQRLTSAGIRVSEFKFTGPSVGELGTALVLALRNRQIDLPDEPALRDELSKVRLRETSPGALRLDHDAGEHDDQAVVLGMACHLLLGKPSPGSGWAFLEHYRRLEAAGELQVRHTDWAALAEKARQRKRPMLIGR